MPDTQYAVPSQRLLAYLADALAFGVLTTAIWFVAAEILLLTGTLPGSFDLVSMWNFMGLAGRLAVFAAFSLFQGPLYFALCHSSPWQATPGKRWQRIVVTDSSGAPIGFAHAVARALANICASGFGVILPLLGLQFVLVSVTKKNRAIHDFLAGTLVVQGMGHQGAKLGYWRLALSIVVPPLFLLSIMIANRGV